MVVLGVAVRHGATPLDDWFHRNGERVWFLGYLASPWVLASAVAAMSAFAVYRRRYDLAIATVVCPIVAMAFARVLKPVFGRAKGPGLAYPSGHATTIVVVMGMFVLVTGAAAWAVAVAVVYSVLGSLGVGVSFHYFTDTVGGLLLGTAIVCVAALVLGRAPHPT
jgi:membrane-associated phospholipid phosphatase